MIIAWFSAGCTSAVACKLALDKYGAENVRLVYIKIDSAHSDNARFIADCERWYGKKIEVIQSEKYKDQFDVIKKTRFINGPNGAACTAKLKKDVRSLFEKQNPFNHQVFGFELSKKEVNRAVRFKEQNPHTKPIFPLIERRISKKEAMFILRENGIKLPKMYSIGFKNNNCIGCVKGGMAYWAKVRKHFPVQFDQMDQIEQEIGRSCINGVELKNLPADHLIKPEKVDMPDCGLFCEIEFADLLSPKTEQILIGVESI